MKLMLLGLLVFLGTHLFTTMRVARAGVIAKTGEVPYKIIYSLISIIGVVMVGYGFAAWRSAGSPQLWFPPVWAKHLALLLVLFACICITSAYPPTHLRVWLKHPMLVGVKTWAVAHLIANGDLAGIVLFTAVLAWAVISRISQKYRPAPRYPEPRLRADIIATAMGLILFWLLGTYFHPHVVGLSVLPS
jgi:uncharacterized membrane protein